MQKTDTLIFIIVAILMIIGGVFSYSLPIFLEMRTGLNEFHFAIRYIGISFIGLVTMIILSYLNPEKWFEKIGFLILISSAILLVIMPFLPPSLAPVINGAKRWINLGIVKLAPVEFFKIGMIFFLSWTFTRKMGNKTLKEELKQIIIYLSFLGFFWFFVIAYQSDLGQVVVMLLIFTLMLFIAGGKYQTVGIIIGIGAILFVISILIKPYRIERIKLWLNRINNVFFPNSETTTSIISNDQLQQSLNAIYHGGVFGTGIGNGVFKLGYLSDVHTDFVLAGIAEESGIIGISLILILITALVYRIFKIAFRNEKKEYQLFAFGIGSLIAIQFIINALGVTSVFPLKGLTVPFLSYGGSSLFALSIGIGMVLMISKKAKL